MSEREVVTHSLRRTNPVGEKFIGRCVLCGREGFTSAGALQECSNPNGTSADQALLDAVNGDRVKP